MAKSDIDISGFLLYNKSMIKFENPIGELTKRIQNHIDNGGSIYQPKRQLPYYDYLSNLKTKFSKRDGVKYETADIYKMCGFDFDPEFAAYLEIVADLRDLADGNNYVDKEINFKQAKSETYGKLCTLATKHGSCLYDFLVLTTGYRLKEANINVDYEKALIEKLKQAYPDKNLAGIRRDNSDLYEMIRHLRRYKYPSLTIAEVVNLLGFQNSKSAHGGHLISDEAANLKKLQALYPSKNIDASLYLDKDFYYTLIRISISKGMSLVQYLNQNGYTYLQGNLVARLAQMKVDEKTRYDYLIGKKREFYISHPIEKLTDKEKYYLNLELVDHVAKIDNISSFIKPQTNLTQI